MTCGGEEKEAGLSRLETPPPSSQMAAISKADIDRATSSEILAHAERRPDGTVINGNIIHSLQVLIGMTQWHKPAPADHVVGSAVLADLLALVEKMPKHDRGFSWEKRNYRDVEEIRAYGENAAVLKFILDNTETLIADLRAATEERAHDNA